METRKTKKNKTLYSHFKVFVFTLTVLFLFNTQQSYATFGPPTRFEAENGFNSNCSSASAYTGYSGSGYVTGFTQNGSETKYYKGASSIPLSQIVIRYANGTGSNVTNLALYIGSNQKIQDLVFPSTGSWTTWSTITVTFNHDGSWGGDIRIVSSANVSASVNIDYSDFSVDDGVAAPSVAIPTFSPVGGTYASAQSVNISTTTTGATIYYTQDGSTPTTASPVYSGTAISVSSTKTIKALATKLNMTNSTVASATYTINIPPPAPGAFTQTAPASGATGVSTSPSFSWAVSSNAATYALVVSTSSSFTSPIINQTGITGTSYTSGTALANSTVYYWKVTATNSTTSTTSTNAGISFTTTAPLPVAATPTFSPVAGTYTTAQPVTISSATSGATIYYTTNGSTPTTASSVYSTAISVGSTQTVKAIATKSGYTNSAVGSAAYTINIPVPAPGAFTQTAPASGATGVSTKPAFSWASSSNAATYALVVSTSSSYTSPVINQTGLTGTSYTPTTALGYNTLYYWKVTATNTTSSTIATNAGLSFTTAATPPPVVGQPGVTREFWAGIAGTTVASLTSNSNYPSNPTSSSVLTSFDAPQNVGETYGQRIKGYVTPSTTGSYTFYIAADDEAELWLSTDDNPANKVKIASVTGWTNYIQYTKFASQTSVTKTLTAGNYYYIEALHKEDTGGDHCSVAWSGPGITQSIITSANLVTAPPIPLPAPGAFTLTAPANAATGVSLAPTFSWAASSDAASYTLVVSTSSSYTSPVINQSGITATSYVAGGLAGTTTYYWKVTATNATSSTVASNAGRSFTTLTPPVPGAFTQTAPASGATSVSRAPTFTWAAASNASTYSLVVSTSSSYTSPAINVSGLTSTSYSASSNLAGSTVYYWKVTAVNSTGPTVATNAGVSFTTSATTGTYYYVSPAPTGVDAPGRGGSGNPFATPSYAATQIAANQNNTIYINAGTYNLTQPIILPLGVNIEGAGTSTTILKSSGVTLPNGVSGTEGDFPLWIEGSLIQLGSPIYSGDNPRYGDPSLMIPAQDGNQTLSGFTIDGNNKSLKAGVWVLNRNNVTVHHVNFVKLKDSGAVFTRGDMYYYIGLADGKWMRNLSVHDCVFTDSGSDLNGGGQNGNLRIGGIDGAQIYNITINDTRGEGIKFMHVGHHRNTIIHDCTINLTEKGAPGIWGDWMAIELWNCSYGNEVYNITTNGWISLATHGPTNDIYQPTTDHPWNLKIHDIQMVSTDLTDDLEAVECAMSGVEFYNNYFQDRPYFIAIWGGIGDGWNGTVRVNKISIHNNIFAKVGLSNSVFGFGDGAAVFTATDAQANNIKIYNNVFDRMGNSVALSAATNVDVANNVFLNSGGDDLNGNAPTRFKNNLRYNTAGNRPNWLVSGGADASNYNGTQPGFNLSGNRATNWYKPSSGSSFSVNKGLDVGIPFSGTPDIGRYEFGINARTEVPVAEVELDENSVSIYPNPSTGIIKIRTNPDVKISAVQVMTLQGKTILNKSVRGINETQIDLNEQSNDVYILRIKHQKGVLTKKIVLVK